MDPKQPYSLSPMQQGLLFHYFRDGRSAADVVQLVCELPEALDVTALHTAWQHAADRHEGLRAWFAYTENGEATQHFADTTKVAFEFADWSADGEEAQAARLSEFLVTDRDAGFDLSSPPLWRIHVIRLGPRDYRCIWTLHHIMADGRSCAGVLEEVLAEYDGRDDDEVTKRYSADAPAPVPSRRVLEWLDARDRSGDEAFWRSQLDGVGTPAPIADEGTPSGTGRGAEETRLSVPETQSLHDAAKRRNVTLNTLVQAAWALVLARQSGSADVVFGVIRAGRSAALPANARSVGVFINTVPMRVRLEPGEALTALLARIRATHTAIRPHEQAPLSEIQRWSAGPHLFDSILIYDHATLDGALRGLGGAWANRRVHHLEHTGYPLTAYGYGEEELLLRVAWARDRVSDIAGRRLLGQFRRTLLSLASDDVRTVADVPVLGEEEVRDLLVHGTGEAAVVPDECVQDGFTRMARSHAGEIAVIAGDAQLTYDEVDRRADGLMTLLLERGVARGERVGICLDRGIDLPVALLGVLRAGAAWVPLDPEYPAERLAFMARDAALSAIVMRRDLRNVLPSDIAATVWMEDIEAADAQAVRPVVSPDDVAYVIYTSGSTGQPKGVQVEHRNVTNFFAAMDRHIDLRGNDVWLALTSLSFDISTLELLWTLTRGVRVVIHGERTSMESPAEFSLFYFASSDDRAGNDRYRLLLDGARWADAHDFEAVWTPERHFHAFGGLYPNPSVTGAAVAAVTDRIAVRAGSVVLPLHHPARVAEEWAVVDRISGGRVGISVASGWHPGDFVLAPERYADRKEGMFEALDQVRRLWRGETIRLAGPKGEIEVGTMPRPVQSELPVWVTTSGTRATFERAGTEGLNLLTHLLGQSLEEVAENIAAYRAARVAAGHDSPGRVTLMVHTFVAEDDDTAKEAVREPLIAYLASSVDLVKNFADAWTAVSRKASAQGPVSLDKLSPEDRDAVLGFAFERYFATSGLLGSVEKCVAMTRAIRAAGVDEIACLIDFGIDTDRTLRHLDLLNEVRLAAAKSMPAEPAPVGVVMAAHGVTHVQCTPSRARLILAEPEAATALAGVHRMLVGGEALPGDLARDLAARVGGQVLNMYGPTETTIWSCVQPVTGDEPDGTVAIGRPVLNTTCRIAGADGGLAPVGVPGELWIGGAGVTPGYLGRAELTAERFVEAPAGGGRMYRTGDVARWRGDGVIEFLGRNDQQVKIRGHRIEIGEVEAALAKVPGVVAAAAKAVSDGAAGTRLLGYIVAGRNGAGPPGDVRAWLADRLPEPMVPGAVMILDALPLTPNGKLDRRALPDVVRSDAAEREALNAPSNAVEKVVADVWREILGVEGGMDVNDNFFDLGGHSLLTIRVQTRLSELLSRKVAITDLFRFPTIRSLAAHLDGASVAEGAKTGSQRADLRRQARSRRAGGR